MKCCTPCTREQCTQYHTFSPASAASVLLLPPATMLRRALRLWPRAVAHTPVPISAFPSRHVPAIRTCLQVRTLAGPGGAAQEKAGSGVALGMDKGRTDITRALWERRTRASNRKTGTDTPVIVEKSPADSLQRVPIPFVSDHLLRAQYVNFRDHIRFGKVRRVICGAVARVHCRHHHRLPPAARRLGCICCECSPRTL